MSQPRWSQPSQRPPAPLRTRGDEPTTNLDCAANCHQRVLTGAAPHTRDDLSTELAQVAIPLNDQED